MTVEQDASTSTTIMLTPSTSPTILILGDGNFSFSLALCSALLPASASVDPLGSSSSAPVVLDSRDAREAACEYLGVSIVNEDDLRSVNFLCTSFDTREEVLDKYPESASILDKLERGFAPGRVKVLHRINAWDLPAHFVNDYPQGFRSIVWNHPHLGTENFQLHRFLMAHFLHSAQSVLTDDASSSDTIHSTTIPPQIIVSLVNGQETRWDIVRQAARSELRLVDVLPFIEQRFPGYVCKRNKTGQSFKNVATQRYARAEMESFVYRFGRTSARSADAIVSARVDATASAIVDNDDGSDIANAMSQLKMEAKGVKLEMASAPITHRTVVYDPLLLKQHRRAKHHRRKVDRGSTIIAVPGGGAPTTLDENVITHYACPDCDKLYSTMRAIQQHHHLRHVLKKEEDPSATTAAAFPCDHAGCERSFAREKDLWYHRTSKHASLTADEEREIMGGDVVGALYCSRDPNVAEAVAETIVKKVDKAPAPVPSDRYMYVPCVVCGQAVLDTPDHAQESHGPSFGMLLHLESLKPIVGMSMECPLRRLDANGERWCTVDRRFIERRALEQHFRMCRQRKLDTERGMAANVTQ